MKVFDIANVFARTNTVVGAYATAPSLLEWDSQSEAEYFKNIFSMPGLNGLEVPYWGNAFCRHDESIFLSQMPSSLNNVVTAIPGIISGVSEDPAFGLASESGAGRKSAIEMMERVRKKIKDTRRVYPNFQCDTVVFCSAPIAEKGSASRKRFKESLKEISNWEWHGCRLVVEHCDEYREDHSHQKGGISLREEIATLADLHQENDIKAKLGITINWGRSALEGRSANTPVVHIAMAKKMGLLSGLMFSGISSEANPYGAWLDTHAPPREVIFDESYSEALLLDHRSKTDCIRLVEDGSLSYIGIKIGAQPANISIAERCRLNLESLKWMNGV